MKSRMETPHAVGNSAAFLTPKLIGVALALNWPLTKPNPQHMIFRTGLLGASVFGVGGP